jgi:hypothetical protein
MYQLPPKTIKTSKIPKMKNTFLFEFINNFMAMLIDIERNVLIKLTNIN